MLDVKTHFKMCSSEGVKSECCPKGEVRPLLCAGLMRSRLLCTPAGLELKKNCFLLPCVPLSPAAVPRERR